MTLSTKLDALKSECPECRAIVFGDLAAGTVLRVVADPSQRQEGHDAVLGEAAQCFGAAGWSLVQRGIGGDGAAPDGGAPLRALSISRASVCLMRRGGEQGQDVLAVNLDPRRVAEMRSGDADAEVADAFRALDAQCRTILDGDD